MTPLERDEDLLIVPFDFHAIVRNVTGCIVVIHGAMDEVISPSEATKLYEGLQTAAAEVEKEEEGEQADDDIAKIRYAKSRTAAPGTMAPHGDADATRNSARPISVPGRRIKAPLVRLRMEGGCGHFMEKTAPVVEEEIMKVLKHGNR